MIIPPKCSSAAHHYPRSRCHLSWVRLTANDPQGVSLSFLSILPPKYSQHPSTSSHLHPHRLVEPPGPPTCSGLLTGFPRCCHSPHCILQTAAGMILQHTFNLPPFLKYFKAFLIIRDNPNLLFQQHLMPCATSPTLVKPFQPSCSPSNMPAHLFPTSGPKRLLSLPKYL